VNIACSTCLLAAKNEAIKLLDILIEDFGLCKHEINIYFSGSMGYHLSVTGSTFEKLDQAARSEIVDYVSGNALIPESLGVHRQSSYKNLIDNLPTETERGWRGRLAKYFKVLKENDEENLKDVKLKMTGIFRKVGYKKFRISLENAARKSGAKVDPSVTTDIHRIFRLSGTLHGKTGLLKKICDSLERFDPLIDAVAFRNGNMKIFVDSSPKFTLMGEQFGPFKSEIVELPMSAAIYLLGLGMAKMEM
jgi:DNA primase small subunit